jgi:hypothetical protein
LNGDSVRALAEAVRTRDRANVTGDIQRSRRGVGRN